MKNYTIDDLLKDHFSGKDIFPFMTIAGMAERWGESPDTVYNRYRRDDSFPEPVEGVVKGLVRQQKIFTYYEVIRYEQERNIGGNKSGEFARRT